MVKYQLKCVQDLGLKQEMSCFTQKALFVLVFQGRQAELSNRSTQDEVFLQ